MKLSFFFAAAQAALFFPLGAVAGPVPTQTENIENIAPRESMPPTVRFAIKRNFPHSNKP